MEPDRQKLRSTCTRCATLKVRCNKERPNCGRCVRAQETCEYTPYRWKGRPGIKRLQSPTQAPGRMEQWRAGEQPSQRMPISSLATISTNELLEGISRGEVPAAVWQTQTPRDADNFEALLGLDLLGLEVPGNTLPLENRDLSPSLLTGTDMSGGIGTSSSAFSPHASSDIWPRPQFVLTGSPSNYRQVGCSQIILGILEAQQQYEPQCKSASAPGGSGFGRTTSNEVMKINRCILQHLEALLSRRCCPTCLAQPDSICLLQSVFERTLRGYDDVFRSFAHSPHWPTHPSSFNDMTPAKPNRVIFEPVQIGDFLLGRQAELKMNAELLACELKILFSVSTQIQNLVRENRQGGVEYADHESHDRSRKNSVVSDESLSSRVERRQLRIRQFCNSLSGLWNGVTGV